MRHGAVMSLRGTASGRLFAAHLPRARVQAASDEVFDAAFEEELAGVRRAGFSRAVDAAVAGVSAIAAPVFDGSGTLVLCLTAIGPTASFDVADDGTASATLRRCAGELSAQLGAQR